MEEDFVAVETSRLRHQVILAIQGGRIAIPSQYLRVGFDVVVDARGVALAHRF